MPRYLCVVFAGQQNLYVGALPEDLKGPAALDELSRMIRAATGCLVIGVRDPTTGQQRLNPPRDELVAPGMEVLYLATEPRLERL